ncbi:hypothetical protein F2Q69_00013167 [Brassica cretica]|uniref:Uncharacterized protein n=1 Tax=Brassica cretica TaxID=69181 RepID=A0A8S9R878_BRACR|nr:hypothetical protein F2Q69_00013167 [Brassica cretica]
MSKFKLQAKVGLTHEPNKTTKLKSQTKRVIFIHDHVSASKEAMDTHYNMRQSCGTLELQPSPSFSSEAPPRTLLLSLPLSVAAKIWNSP